MQGNRGKFASIEEDNKRQCELVTNYYNSGRRNNLKLYRVLYAENVINQFYIQPLQNTRIPTAGFPD